jgi:Zn-dependent protease/CBS domain-containing protein
MAQSGSIPLVRLLDFEVRVHWSWLLIFGLLSWSLASGYLPDVYPTWSTGQQWLVAVLTSLLFFGSVLAHELSHSVMARRRGIPVHGITLFIFGGVSQLGDEPRAAKDEFWVAVVGPLTSFAVAAVCAVGWLAARSAGAEVVAAVAGYLAYVNVAVGIFNLLPGFPLDGGRVLRATVWGAKGDMLDATRVAAMAGRIVAWLLVAVGALSIFTGGALGGFWLILIGWFLANAAESSYEQALLDHQLRGVVVSSLTEPLPPLVPPETTLQQFVDEYLLRHNRRAFIVGVDGGEPVGLISMSDLGKLPREQWAAIAVAEAMTPLGQLVTVRPSANAREALRVLSTHDVHQLPVMEGQRIAGLLTRAGLLQAIQMRRALGIEDRRSPRS